MKIRGNRIFKFVAANRIFMVIAVLCWVNGFAWSMIGPHIGGSALGGKVEGDNYFLGSHVILLRFHEVFI